MLARDFRNFVFMLFPFSLGWRISLLYLFLVGESVLYLEQNVRLRHNEVYGVCPLHVNLVAVAGEETASLLLRACDEEEIKTALSGGGMRHGHQTQLALAGSRPPPLLSPRGKGQQIELFNEGCGNPQPIICSVFCILLFCVIPSAVQTPKNKIKCFFCLLQEHTCVCG